MKKEWININEVLLPVKCFHAKFINGFYVPCGKCAFCRASMSREWSFRIEQESYDKYVYNCLLTYDDEHLPYHDGKPTLEKVDFQLFMKRFRYIVDEIYGGKVRYFLVGEYGGKKHRPHYHLLLFSDVKFEVSSRNANPLDFISSLMESTWRKGFCDVEPVENASATCHYMTAYLMNTTDGRKYDKYNKPFKLMSCKPAIGAGWFERNKHFIEKCIKTMNYTRPVSLPDGRTLRMPLPRYYKRKIMPEEQQIMFADKFYKTCQEFREWRVMLNPRESLIYELKKRELIKIQEDRDAAEYRKRKIHDNGRLASKVFARAPFTR